MSLCLEGGHGIHVHDELSLGVTLVEFLAGKAGEALGTELGASVDPQGNTYSFCAMRLTSSWFIMVCSSIICWLNCFSSGSVARWRPS